MLIEAQNKVKIGNIIEAIKLFELVIKRAKSTTDIVAEGISNFHLGIALFKMGEKERARSHLVEFQILS